MFAWSKPNVSHVHFLFEGVCVPRTAQLCVERVKCLRTAWARRYLAGQKGGWVLNSSWHAAHACRSCVEGQWSACVSCVHCSSGALWLLSHATNCAAWLGKGRPNCFRARSKQHCPWHQPHLRRCQDRVGRWCAVGTELCWDVSFSGVRNTLRACVSCQDCCLDCAGALEHPQALRRTGWCVRAC